MSTRHPVLLVGALALVAASPLAAQDADTDPDAAPPGEQRGGPPTGETVFDGDFLSIGVGAGLGPSYTGSNDYVIFPLPIIQASYKGVNINPRPAGLAVDFIPDAETGPSFDLGVAFRVRSDRVDQIEDEVVKQLGELDRAVEVGPTVGVSFPGVLNPFDSVSVNVDAMWDVAGAHSGMTVSPSVTYFTPLSRGVAASISGSATFIDDDFADYYFSVSPADTVASGGVLPAFQAEGGLQSVGVNLLLAVDLNGDVTDGGLNIVGIGGYSRLMNDAKNTPLTSVRGSANQFLLGVGLGYTF
ncbi:MipA/OmpV family protein [Qipengyuania sp. DSG2-2]|uniref:MipA/OmpV family protein n=1 Tax=Qipengyuania sp. DGS2-2 TaxID=3349631 RepID=UPI0036D33DC5